MKHILRRRYGHALTDPRSGQWSELKFSDMHLYFLGKEPQKNGGMSGISVRVDLLRPRVRPSVFYCGSMTITMAKGVTQIAMAESAPHGFFLLTMRGNLMKHHRSAPRKLRKRYGRASQSARLARVTRAMLHVPPGPAGDRKFKKLQQLYRRIDR